MTANIQPIAAVWPRPVRRALEAMADADLRTPDNFLAWLILSEARRRGLVTPDPAAEPSEARTAQAGAA